MGMLCWLVIGAGWAGSNQATRSQIEATMLVSGSLSVDETGRVTANTVDHPEQLPAAVVQLVQQTLPTFRFQPVLHDGKPQPVHAAMHLVVAANQVDPKHVAIRIRSARFTESGTASSEQITVDHRGLLRFPEEAIKAGVSGTVYVAVRIDRSGTVLDAQVQQVNLRVVDNARQMKHWRDAFAKPTLAGIRHFTFNVPTNGSHADDQAFTGILPVSYYVDNQGPPKYGQWDPYVPGPRQDIAWLDDEEVGASEAIPDGAFAQTGTDMKLLTPLGS